MVDGYREFDRRIRDLDHQKAAILAGAKAEVDDTGLMALKPVGQFRRGVLRLLPIRALMILVAIGTAVKVFLLVWMGTPDYVATLDQMNGGDTLNRVGGWLMQIDPVTARLAEYVGPLFG